MTKEQIMQVFRACADEPGDARISDFRAAGVVTAANSLSATAMTVAGGAVMQIGQARFFLDSNEEIILIPDGYSFADYPLPRAAYLNFFGKAVTR